MSNNQLKRASWRDYRMPGRYMITLVKRKGIENFSSIEIKDPSKPISPSNTFTRWTPLGNCIANHLYGISTFFPDLVVEQYSVMPDHVHFLLFVKAPLAEHMGRYIARLKVIINKAVGIDNIFEDGFNDQILKSGRRLEVLYDYIRTNPYRLAVRRMYPDFFERCNNLVINGVSCWTYGNIHLLDNPFKDQVIVHRADSDEIFALNKIRWLYTASNGGVLVSPFISKREKEVRAEAEEAGGRFILIVNRPFGEREKPTGKDFELCTAGRLLVVYPTEPYTFSRDTCLKMNSLAESLVQSF